MQGPVDVGAAGCQAGTRGREREQLKQEAPRLPGHPNLVSGLGGGLRQGGEGVEDPPAAASGEPPWPEPQEILDRVFEVGGAATAAAPPVGVASAHVIEHVGRELGHLKRSTRSVAAGRAARQASDWARIQAATGAFARPSAAPSRPCPPIESMNTVFQQSASVIQWPLVVSLWNRREPRRWSSIPNTFTSGSGSTTERSRLRVSSSGAASRASSPPPAAAT